MLVGVNVKIEFSIHVVLGTESGSEDLGLDLSVELVNLVRAAAANWLESLQDLHFGKASFVLAGDALSVTTLLHAQARVRDAVLYIIGRQRQKAAKIFLVFAPVVVRYSRVKIVRKLTCILAHVALFVIEADVSKDWGLVLVTDILCAAELTIFHGWLILVPFPVPPGHFFVMRTTQQQRWRLEVHFWVFANDAEVAGIYMLPQLREDGMRSCGVCMQRCRRQRAESSTVR